MPAATPIPRAPKILILDSPAALLTGPGCPVCRYADEASDRYLAWFAFEAHAQADTITRLCESLGMCPPHTRSLMRQPGAEVRLTAVYRYLVQAARDRLTGPAAHLGRCPACDHDHEAAGRAADTLIEGLADSLIRERYLELGGLCLPHLRVASARAGRGHSRRVAAWLADAVMATVSSRPASPVWLAGTDRDTPERAALRQAAQAGPAPGPAECAACLAAARSEGSGLAQILHTRDYARLLCLGHLNDLIALAGRSGAASVLAGQVGCLAAAPARRVRRRAVSLDRCPVCLAAEDAAQQAIADLRGWLRASHQVPGCRVPLCVRHLLVLRTVDPRAGRVTGPGGVERADTLAAELDEAFGKNTWTHRLEAKGPEMTAWQRAAAFLDGGVFCGCAARQA